jgi:hypothetical protein
MIKELFFGLTKIIFAIVLAVGVIYLSSLKKHFPYALNKVEKKIFLLEDIDVGIYGHSHSKGGIDAPYLGNKTKLKIFNFSNAGTSLLYNIRLIENNLKFNPNQKIILEIGSNNLGYNGMLRSLVDARLNDNGFYPFKYYLANNFHFLNANDLTLFFRLNPFETLQAVIKGSLILPNLYTGIDINEPNLKSSIDKLDHIEKKINEKWKKTVDINFEFVELKKLILKKPETSFLLLRVPEHNLSLKIYNQEKRFDSLKKVFNSFSNVKFVDYSNMQFDTNDYKDISHLSKFGMRKFSDTLLLKQQELFKKLD